MKNKIFLILMGLVLMPAFALADGMVVPPHDYEIAETGQKAAIFYENGREDLVLSVGFKGTADKFSWIVPTPNKPEIKKGSDKTFFNLEEYTQPKETLLNRFINWLTDRSPDYGYDGGIVPMQSTSINSEETAKLKVKVVEEKQVGIFDTVTLKAENSADLETWLKENGFQTGTITTNKVIQEYIDNGWYFVAMKVNNDYQTEKISGELNTGTISPIILSFNSDKMIYPLKISSLDFGSVEIPKGSWKVTCRNEKIENNNLQAECQKIDQEWTQATINLEQCRSTVQNINGKLTCDKYYDDPYQNIYLYVFGDGKYNAENYQGYQSYAENLSAKKINSFFNGTINKTKSYFLTKIDLTSIRKDSMNKDLLFVKDEDNKDINSGKMTINEKFQLGFLATFVFLYFPITLLLSQGLIAALLVGVIYMILYIITVVRSIKNPDKHNILRTVLQTYLMAPAVFVLSLLLFGLYVSTSSSFYSTGLLDSGQAVWVLVVGAFISLVISYAISRLFTRYARRKNKLNKILAKYGDKIDNG